MKENAPMVEPARDASTETLRDADKVPFHIVEVRRVAYGSKTAEFSVATPLGVIEADLFRPENRAPFVQARSVRDKFSGQWRHTIALDRRFAARLLEALENLGGERGPGSAKKMPAADPSKILLESEERFEEASRELLDAGGHEPIEGHSAGESAAR